MRQSNRLWCAVMAVAGGMALVGQGCVGSEPVTAGGSDAGGVDDAAADTASGIDGASVDASSSDTGSADADAGSAACAPNAPFGAPQLLQGVNTGNESTLSLSPEELTIYFARGSTSDLANLYSASRSGPTQAFGSVAVLPGLNSPGYDLEPSLSADGLSLFFMSDRAGTLGNQDIWFASRTTTLTGFGNVANVTVLNTPANDTYPFIAADGTQLWFSSERSGGVGSSDLYVAERAGSGFAAPTNVSELNTTATEWAPVLSVDRLTIFFASYRSDGGAVGKMDIWTSHRANVSAPFGAPVNVAAVNSVNNEWPGWLSSDGCRLYMSSDRTGGATSDLYVAARGK
jgi:Tol biopolymer transport system component